MSLLESMRSGTDSAAMQVIFAAVVVSFVFMGMGNYGDRTEVVATVNGEEIHRIEFERSVADRERRMGDALSADDLAALRERVLQDMIRRSALLQEAVALGIEVSDGEVAKVLLDIDFLKDSTGRFDMQTYELFLRRQGTSRSKFEEDIREDITLGKLEDLMRLGASVSEPLVKQTYVEENTKLDIEYVRVRPTSFLIAVDPTEEEISTWIEDNGEALQAEYDQDFATKYDLPETLSLSLIRLGVQAEDGYSAADLKPKIDKVKASVEAGEDFASLARTWSEDRSALQGGKLGEVKVTSLDPDVQAALDGVEVGGLTKVVVGDRDLSFYRVDSREPARVIPLTEVQDELARDMMRRSQAPVKAAQFAENDLLAAWSTSGEVPQDALDEYGLRVDTTGPIAASGQGAGAFMPPARMIKAARTADVGSVLSEVFEEDGILWVGRLSEREDADMSEFEDDHDRIREIALLKRRSEFFRGWVDDVVARAVVER